MIPEEKALTRIKRLLAMAARRDGNEHEAHAAARRLYLTLEGNPLPLRYLVMPGAEARLLPAEFVLHPDRMTKLKRVTVRRRNMFSEAHRVKNKQGQEALELGFFAFTRYGYMVFVKLADTQIFF